MRTRMRGAGRIGRRTVSWASALLLGAGAACAQTTYVSALGSDAAGVDGSYGNPWLTISNAVARTAAGTVLVATGQYVLSTRIAITKALTVRSWNEGAGGGVDPANTVIDGAGSVRCVTVSNAAALLAGFTVSNGNAIADAAINGGGIAMYAGTVSNCLVMNNVASNEGGGVYMNGTTRLVDSTLRANTITPSFLTWSGGAGVRVAAGATVSRCQILTNIVVASSNSGDRGVGAGVYFFAGGLVSNCVIADNFTSNTYGGGMFFQNGGTLTHSTVRGNSARGAGGAYSLSMVGYIQTCLIESNLATYVYGGVYLGGPSQMRNCLVRANTGPSVGGVFAANNNTVVESCTIVSNYCSSAGDLIGGLAVNSTSAVFIANNVIYRNRSASGSNSNYYNTGAGCSNWWNNCTAPSVAAYGSNNLSVDPEFRDPDNGDFRPRPESRCVDAGFDQTWMTGAADLDGAPRIDRIGRRSDMGAYECLRSVTLMRLR